MAWIDTVEEHRAGDEVAALYDSERQRTGYVPNYTRVFSHRPEAYRAWRQLIGAIAGSMEPRRYELVTLAAARELRTRYCLLAHGRILRDRFLGPECGGWSSTTGRPAWTRWRWR